MTSEDKVWNDAVDAFADRLIRFYYINRYEFHHMTVAYHSREIAKDMKRGDSVVKN